MTDKDINHWIMYHEIHNLARLGLRKTKIARHLVLDPRTVAKYLSMSEDQYEHYRDKTRHRTRILSPYEAFVRQKLNHFPDTPAAQMHDWLKEHHPDFPPVGSRTVYNFVMFVRARYNIPVSEVPRNYFPVEEPAYGLQAQVDFGQYNMRKADGGRKKVWFFVMVLSRSRMKFTVFSDVPFTSATVCLAHEQAFAFFGGMPQTIVYDLDRIMVVDENLGDILLTEEFKKYVRSAGFKLHFCRKSDPESKGKVENVVGYIKKNFLYNHLYVDLEMLNGQALAWLDRTANHLEHNVTKKSPKSQYLIEKSYLKPCKPLPMHQNTMKPYYVRKTNVISYKSNFYSLPEGTYRGPDTQVLLKESDGKVYLYTCGDDPQLIGTHQRHTGKGKTVINSNHRRDRSKSVEEWMSRVAGCFYLDVQSCSNKYFGITHT